MFVSVFPLRIHNLNNYSLSVEISNEQNEILKFDAVFLFIEQVDILGQW